MPESPVSLPSALPTALVPSCALMLKFEWPLILPKDPAIERLAQATFDLSEYVVDVAKTHGLAEFVAQEEMERLFDPYYRASNSEKSGTGWGLGLAFVKRIAEKHGGSVRADSQSSGTQFEIRLPAKMQPVMAVKEIQ